MNKKYSFFFFFFIFIISNNNSNAQSVFLNIYLENGSKVIFNFNNINKITMDPITNVNDLQKLNSILNSFKLSQNFPNPFNPSTSIKYNIPKPGKIEIKIYNINGQLIKSITKEHLQKGEYKVDWKGTNNQGSVVATGIYFYQAHFEDQVLSKRMIYLK